MFVFCPVTDGQSKPKTSTKKHGQEAEEEVRTVGSLERLMNLVGHKCCGRREFLKEISTSILLTLMLQSLLQVVLEWVLGT